MKSVSRGSKLAVARPAQFVECWNQVCEVMGLYTGETTNQLLFLYNCQDHPKLSLESLVQLR